MGIPVVDGREECRGTGKGVSDTGGKITLAKY
jgi:hypothetical protein